MPAVLACGRSQRREIRQRTSLLSAAVLYGPPWTEATVADPDQTGSVNAKLWATFRFR